ncbi:MAG: hypothetical protein HRK26_05355 [Rickettsiaceae bacterium H1]|nr:hypothetical protein [Rickettsiaceae bacterium H1]
MRINESYKLSEFCNEVIATNPDFIAIDTEFISNRKYRNFPKLCLIQIAYNNKVAVIDVLSQDVDLSILNKLFLNSKITKVFHDFKQDILALLTVFDYVPRPMMDTQMMAMLCDYHNNYISYLELIYSLLDVKLMKESTRTDWLSRPLSDKQIEYAVADVTYLCSVYKILFKRLQKLNRLNWAKDDVQEMIEKLAIPHSTKNDKPNMVRQVLCEYRIDNKLVNGVTDSQIYRLSYAKKITKQLLKKLVNKEYLDELYEMLSCQKKESLVTGEKKSLIYLIQALVQQYCLKNNISYQSISSLAEINRLVNDEPENIRLLQGWRGVEIGEKITDFLKGKIMLEIGVIGGDLNVKLS